MHFRFNTLQQGLTRPLHSIIQHRTHTSKTHVRQVSRFLWVLQFPPPMKLTATT